MDLTPSTSWHGGVCKKLLHIQCGSQLTLAAGKESAIPPDGDHPPELVEAEGRYSPLPGVGWEPTLSKSGEVMSKMPKPGCHQHHPNGDRSQAHQG